MTIMKSDITMTERRISPLEKRICDRLDDLVDQLKENKKEQIEQADRFFSWIDEQSKHCRQLHTQVDIVVTALKTDYNNTKESLKETKDYIQDRFNFKMEFKSRIVVALIAIVASALFGACIWAIQKALEK